MVARELAVVGVADRRRDWRRPQVAVALLVPVAATEAASGHAATHGALALASMALHILAAGLWVGGLIVLARSSYPAPSDATSARRSPASAGWPRPASACSIVTGLYSAGRRSRALTPCSRRRMAGRSSTSSRCVAVTGGLGLLGLLALRRARPSLGLLRAEAIGAVGILATASLLLASAPARGPQFAPGPRPIAGTPLATGQADDLLVDLSAAPNRPGQNFVTATILDTLRPSPGPVRRVVITFARGSRRLTATAVRLDANRWQVAGTQLSAPGAWRIAVAAERRGLPRTPDATPWTVASPLGLLPARRAEVLAAPPPADPLRARSRAGGTDPARRRLASRRAAHAPATTDRVMRAVLVLALAGAALLPVPAAAATPMRALIVHLDPAPVPRSLPAREVAGTARAEQPRGAGTAARPARGTPARGSRPPRALALDRRRGRGHGRRRSPSPRWGPPGGALDRERFASARSTRRTRHRRARCRRTGAPELWSHGIDGSGMTVATLDTGVDLTHAELAGRYRGGSHGWFDPFGEHARPVDLNGHGTQVIGVMVAGDGIGMAPGAHFIAARVFNDSGVSTDSAVHLAFQWLLDPDGNPATDDAPTLSMRPGAHAGHLRHGVRTRSAGAARGAHPSGVRRRQRWSRRLLRHVARRTFPRPSRSARRRPTPRSPRSRASARLAADGDAVPLARRRRHGHPLDRPLRLRRDGPRGYVLRRAARRGRAGAPPPGGAAAERCGRRRPCSQQQRARPRSAGSRLHVRCGLARRRRCGASALPVARLHSADDLEPRFCRREIRVHAIDGSSPSPAAELWVDADPGVGSGHADARPATARSTPPRRRPRSRSAGACAGRARDRPARARRGRKLEPARCSFRSAFPVPPAATSPSPSPGVATLASTSRRCRLVHVSQLALRTRRFRERTPRSGTCAARRSSTSREAATHGRRGLRVSIGGGERAFVGRRLPRAGDELELQFDLTARTIGDCRAWSRVAAIDGPGGGGSPPSTYAPVRAAPCSCA